ncbi:MAG: hypothetical protein EAY75_01430, partial [Bacteroidetes bacterium]
DSLRHAKVCPHPTKPIITPKSNTVVFIKLFFISFIILHCALCGHSFFLKLVYQPAARAG